MWLQFGFVIFWQKDFGAKAAHKILVKLTLKVKESNLGDVDAVGENFSFV
jgi:hypothetical protein